MGTFRHAPGGRGRLCATPAQRCRELSPTLIVIGASVSAAFVVWGVQFAKEGAISSGLRLIGSVLLLVVAASHFAEKFRWLAWMGWGLPNSPGHYVDLVSAIVGGSLFSAVRFVFFWR